GIIQWPQAAEARVRRLDGGRIVHAENDPLVPDEIRQQYPLRPGLEVTVEIGQRKKRRRGKGTSTRTVVESLVAIEGGPPQAYADRPAFEDLTSIDPQPRITLEYPGCPAACRLIDLFCPIGRGQRALIVSPPKAGKTTLLKDIATATLRNHPEIHVIALLVDERPEQVTDFRRSLLPAPGADPASWAKPWDPARVQLIASSNDHDVARHIEVCLTTIERCKRMVEAGKHVLVILDSLTRVGRAFNRSQKHSSSGRTLSGGIDSRAMEMPRQIFG